MIVLHAEIPVDPDRKEEALELAEFLVEESNEESGMIEYRAAVDVQDENVIRFFEQYENEQALEAHTRFDHYQEFEERLPELVAGEPEVMRFDVSEATELEV
ncbi:MAG: putative quinol monooxygenase [Halobacteriaceae archaeon]